MPRPHRGGVSSCRPQSCARATQPGRRLGTVCSSSAGDQAGGCPVPLPACGLWPHKAARRETGVGVPYSCCAAAKRGDAFLSRAGGHSHSAPDATPVRRGTRNTGDAHARPHNALTRVPSCRAFTQIRAPEWPNRPRHSRLFRATIRRAPDPVPLYWTHLRPRGGPCYAHGETVRRTCANASPALARNALSP
jgi:hypothetical protein